jgi:hypothetical protein
MRGWGDEERRGALTLTIRARRGAVRFAWIERR